jgi:MFS transporter, CP family, cyanate transporter
MKPLHPSSVVILAGVSAALHVGKLAPALPALRGALGVSLLEAGFLLSLVQLAGMSLGLAAGLAADALGLRRTMVLGLLILAAASAAGARMDSVQGLLAMRAAEGLGFLLAVMPAPGLLRRAVPAEKLQAALGLWGAYMPFATALALFAGPFAIQQAGWAGWWWLMSALSACMALWVWFGVPADPAAVPAPTGWMTRLRRTLSSQGPWLVALSFAAYSGQWLAVIGFLPSIYAQAGFAGAGAAAATGLAAAVNIGGNVASGRLLQRGVAPQHLLLAGFAAMGAGSILAFAPLWPASSVGGLAQYAAVLLFSMLGGLIPGTLFSLAVRLAPDEGTVSTAVGWMQQWSSLGQFAGPPAVAWMATQTGGWQWSWTVTAACAAAGCFLAQRIASVLRRKRGG